MSIEDLIKKILRQVSTQASDELCIAKARQALIQDIPGVAFSEITVHRDERGRLRRIDISYMDEIHDPSVRTVSVDCA